MKWPPGVVHRSAAADGRAYRTRSSSWMRFIEMEDPVLLLLVMSHAR